MKSKPSHRITLKRVYDAPSAQDGCRLLVERLWPRGLGKEVACLDGWLREAAPSTRLRQWFNHDPARWREFQRRYRAELRAHPESWLPILGMAEDGPVTLLFSSRDTAHNNVVALHAFLSGQKERSPRRLA